MRRGVLSLRRGTVTAISERLKGLVRLEVDGRPCIAYPRLTGPVGLGDDVVVNVEAVELGLGSGGFDVLHVNLTRGLGLDPASGAHVMKLPYTSLQHSVRHAEEEGAEHGAARRAPRGLLLPAQPTCAVCAGSDAKLRVAFVQLEGGALPVSLSDAVRALKRQRSARDDRSGGACVDGDVGCVTPASALAWCAEEGFDVVVCGIGPGIVGTASTFGHGGLAAATAAAVAGALGGSPILVARISGADQRERHHGVSHHLRAVLALAGPVDVAWPERRDSRRRSTRPCPCRWTAGRGVRELPLLHMGRGPADDPWFFAAASPPGGSRASGWDLAGLEGVEPDRQRDREAAVECALRVGGQVEDVVVPNPEHPGELADLALSPKEGEVVRDRDRLSIRDEVLDPPNDRDRGAALARPGDLVL